jgi:hypothetical protein
MVTEKTSFKVQNNKFWILEKKDDTSSKKKEFNGEVWVFEKEQDAINKLKERIAPEIDLENIDETTEKLGKKWSLQEVEIGMEKYNIKSISWLKVFLLSSV